MSKLPSVIPVKSPVALSDITNSKVNTQRMDNNKSSLKRKSLIPRLSSQNSLTRSFELRGHQDKPPQHNRMLKNGESELIKTRKPSTIDTQLGGSAAEYIELLDAYIDQDVILEKQQTIEIMDRIRSTSKCIEDLNLEKNQLIRDKKKLIGMLDDGRFKYEELDKSLIIKAKQVENEISRHKKLVESKKKELLNNFEKKFQELEQQFEELVTASLTEDITDRQREKIIADLEQNIAEMKQSIEMKKKDNDLKLKKYINEVKSSYDRKRVEIERELENLQCEVSGLATKKQRLTDNVVEVKGNINEKTLQIQRLREHLINAEQFNYSIDDSMIKLKMKRSEIIDKISAKSEEIEEHEKCEHQTFKQEYELVKEQYDNEIYTRIKIENQIRELKKMSRVMLVTDKVIASDGFEIFDTDYDFITPLKIFLEDSLTGLSFTVAHTATEQEIDTIYENLISRSKLKRFEHQNFEIFKATINDIDAYLSNHREYISKLDSSNYDCNANVNVIVIECLDLRTKKHRMSIITILNTDILLNSDKMMPLYKLTKSFTVLRLRDDEDDLLQRFKLLKNQITYTDNATAYKFMNQ